MKRLCFAAILAVAVLASCSQYGNDRPIVIIPTDPPESDILVPSPFQGDSFDFGFDIDAASSPAIDSRIEIGGTIGSGGIPVGEGANEATADSVTAFYMWFCPIFEDFLPRSAVSGNSGKLKLFSDNIKVPYETKSEDVDGKSMRVTETKDPEDVMFCFEYDPEAQAFSFVQAIAYTLDFKGEGSVPNAEGETTNTADTRLHVTWGNDIPVKYIDNDEVIHGETYWAFLQVNGSDPNNFGIQVGNADFFSNVKVTGAVGLKAANPYKDDFQKFAESYGYTAAQILACGIDLADLIVAYGSQNHIVDAIHNAKNPDPAEQAADESAAEDQIFFDSGREYYILVYYDKEPPHKGLMLGSSLVDFISGNGNLESAKQKALEASDGDWVVEDYNSSGGNGGN